MKRITVATSAPPYTSRKNKALFPYFLVFSAVLHLVLLWALPNTKNNPKHTTSPINLVILDQLRQHPKSAKQDAAQKPTPKKNTPKKKQKSIATRPNSNTKLQTSPKDHNKINSGENKKQPQAIELIERSYTMIREGDLDEEEAKSFFEHQLMSRVGTIIDFGSVELTQEESAIYKTLYGTFRKNLFKLPNGRVVCMEMYPADPTSGLPERTLVGIC